MANFYYRYDLWVKTAQGPALAGVQVYVCNQPANTSVAPPSPLAAIFSDPNGLFLITQPIQTDGFGHADFYVVAGIYTIIVAIGGVIINVYPDQSIGTASLNGVFITGTPVAGQALIATGPTSASWQTIVGTVLNFPAVPNAFLNSYNSATGMFTSAQPILNGIGNPNGNVDFVFDSTTFTRSYSGSYPWNESLVNTMLATVSQNYNSPAIALFGSVWNGSTATPDRWDLYGLAGAGANPTSILFIEHAGSTGIASVKVPNLITANATISGIIYDNNDLPGTAGQVLTSTSSGVVWAAGGGGGGVTSLFGTTGAITSSTVFASTVIIADPAGSLFSMDSNAIPGGFALVDAGAEVQINSDYPSAGQLQFMWNGNSTMTFTATGVTLAGPGGTLTAYAQIASPALTGVPTAPTAAMNTSTTQLATTAFVHTAVGSFMTTGQGIFLGPGVTTSLYALNWEDDAAPLDDSANVVDVFMFTLASSWTLRSCSFIWSNNLSGTASFGIYTVAGNLLIDSGTFNLAGATNTPVKNTFTAVVLPPGVYWFAQTASGAGINCPAFIWTGTSTPGAGVLALLNTPQVTVGTAANPRSGGGAMPATLGTVTAQTSQSLFPAACVWST